MTNDGKASADSMRDEFLEVHLNNKTRIFSYSTSNKLTEERIYNSDIIGFFSGMAKNVQNIWDYAFSQMMNNAIERMEGKNPVVRLIPTNCSEDVERAIKIALC